MNAPKNRRRKAAEPVAVPAMPPAAVSLPVEPMPEALATVVSPQPPASRPLPRYQPIVPGEGQLTGLAAIIDVGSSAIRLLVVELHGPGDWRQIDGAEKPVFLGRDVFTSGKISAKTITQALNILFGFRELLDSYGVTRVRAIGTSALREASNRETFVDRVRLRTGIPIEQIDGLEANFLTYLAVLHATRELPSRLREANALIMEVGGGSTEIMILEGGRMVAAHTLHIGTVRMLLQTPHRGQGHFGKQLESYQSESIRGTIEVLNAELSLKQISEFIGVGGEARLVARWKGTPTGRHCARVSRQDLRAFVNHLETLSVDETVKLHSLPYRDAETLLPALLVYLLILEATGAEALLVPQASIRDGALLEMTRGLGALHQEELRQQVLASAHAMGRKYRYDRAHGEHVAHFASRLFDALSEEHGLGSHERLLLEAASILHDIGTFVNPSAHHKHGHYLVANSEIFGLRRADLDIIANVIRYHRKSMPKPTHLSFMALTGEQRLVVLKLASLLRVADGLDRGHGRQMHEITITKTDGEVLLQPGKGTTRWLERSSVASKADLFEEVFGLKLLLT